MYYSKSTGGFYDRDIHGENIPADSVEITKDQHIALMYGQSKGKRIIADDDGLPVLADELPPTNEQLAHYIRSQRASLLGRADFAINNAEDNGADPSVWRKYRQQLRDITKQNGFPLNINWPVMPS